MLACDQWLLGMLQHGDGTFANSSEISQRAARSDCRPRPAQSLLQATVSCKLGWLAEWQRARVWCVCVSICMSWQIEMAMGGTCVWLRSDPHLYTPTPIFVRCTSCQNFHLISDQVVPLSMFGQPPLRM